MNLAPPTRARHWLLAAFWGCVAAVTALALLPLTLPLPSTGWDKGNHVLSFVALGVLAVFCWPADRWRVLALLLAYGVGIEVAQTFTATRSGDWRDVVADAGGLVLAGMAMLRR